MGISAEYQINSETLVPLGFGQVSKQYVQPFGIGFVKLVVEIKGLSEVNIVNSVNCDFVSIDCQIGFLVVKQLNVLE